MIETFSEDIEVEIEIGKVTEWERDGLRLTGCEGKDIMGRHSLESEIKGSLMLMWGTIGKGDLMKADKPLLPYRKGV